MADSNGYTNGHGGSEDSQGEILYQAETPTRDKKNSAAFVKRPSLRMYPPPYKKGPNAKASPGYKMLNCIKCGEKFEGPEYLEKKDAESLRLCPKHLRDESEDTHQRPDSLGSLRPSI